MGGWEVWLGSKRLLLFLLVEFCLNGLFFFRVVGWLVVWLDGSFVRSFIDRWLTITRYGRMR